MRYAARIERPADGSEIPCTIHDVSQTGARLSLDDTADVPDAFVLRLSFGRQALRHCAVMWRSEASLGVRFITMDETTR